MTDPMQDGVFISVPPEGWDPITHQDVMAMLRQDVAAGLLEELRDEDGQSVFRVTDAGLRQYGNRVIRPDEVQP